MLREEELTGTIIRCFYRVYDEMGFGFSSPSIGAH